MPQTLFLRRLVAVCALLALAGSGQSASAATAEMGAEARRCENTELEADERLAACTAVIEDASQPAQMRAAAYVSRGQLNSDNEDYADAVADFNEALKLDPKDPATLILRGNAYDGLGEADRAIADYTAAIALNPGDAAPYYNRGAIHHERGERERAAADYRRALAIDPTFEAAQEGLAELGER